MTVWINPQAAGMVAHLGGVQDTVMRHGKTLAARADVLLTQHRYSGTAHIDVHRDRPDVVVSLVDEAAMSIEFGHIAANGRIVEGLGVVRTAAGLR